ncbi:TPA: pheA operon leader peptide PheL [Salmonella enterica]|nr:pheA operon leader peptide PheL [Salmonella enterica]
MKLARFFFAFFFTVP